MSPAIDAGNHPRRRLLAAVAFATAVVLGAAACGSSTKTKTAAGRSAAITVSGANVAGVGTVLVNGDGRTLYALSSERGGKITCTEANGCTKVWPDTELPAGTAQGIAGAGVQASLLGTAKGATGDLYLTYGGWPLYTYSGDSGPGQANGQGITSFGGTWSTLTPAGTPIAAAPGAPAATTTSPASSVGSPATAPNTTARHFTAPPSTTPITSPPRTAPPTTSAPPSTTPVTKPCAYPPCY
jgi:predicted lipoprotein with Yx(FWY)xxD motif